MSRPLILSLLAALCFTLTPLVDARAQSAAPPVDVDALAHWDRVQQQPRYVTDSYKRTMMMVDGAAWALFLSSLAAEDYGAGGTLMAAGGLAFALGGPILHLSQGNTGKALGSLAMRTLLPSAAMLLGREFLPPIPGDAIGVVLPSILAGMGALIAVQVFDARSLAKTRRRVDSAGGLARTWAPTLSLTSRVKTVGLTGTW